MDLTTQYLGLNLSNPLVPSSSRLSGTLDNLKRMEDAGAGAVVLWSLFEEQVRHGEKELDFYLHYGADRWAESLSYFPGHTEVRLGPDEYLHHVAAAKKAVGIPVIASLNGLSTSGWVEYARELQQAGADALELNVYHVPTSPELTGAQVENIYLSVTRAVRSAVTIPVAVKLPPYFSSITNLGVRLSEAGANGLILFNRFCQPDIDLNELEVIANLDLSTSYESRLPMRWIAVLYGKVKASLAASSGVHNAEDVAKMILAGADATQVCSVLLLHGIDHLRALRDGLVQFMDAKGYASVSEMKGVLSQKSCPEPRAFEQANYMDPLPRYGRTATLE